MPVKFFVSKDPSGKEWPPDNSHETLAAIDICRRLWQAFESQEKLFVLLANLHRPNADIVLLTNHGIGIIELKHYYGQITLSQDGGWYAGKTRMGAGTMGARNPHEQVQKYADSVRKKVISPAPNVQWLAGRRSDWPNYKFQTAVCFTHPDAMLTSFRELIRKSNILNFEDWENFSILVPSEVTAWGASLRFEVQKGSNEGYEPNRLDPAGIIKIVTSLFNCKEWTEIIHLMPSGEPYAHLSIIEKGQHTATFALDRDDILVGRNVQACHVALPDVYSNASRTHCRIIRKADGIFIKDSNSTNGTFVDGERVQGMFKLGHHHQVTLGGPVAGAKVCLLDFAVQEESLLGNSLNMSTEKKTSQH